MKSAVLLVLACVVPISGWSPAMMTPTLGGLRAGTLGAARAMPALARMPRLAAPAAASAARLVPASWKMSLGTRSFSKTTPLRMAAATDTDVASLEAKIKEQGETVRDLKEAKAAKEEIDAAVAVLKELKADFEAQAGYSSRTYTNSHTRTHERAPRCLSLSTHTQAYTLEMQQVCSFFATTRLMMPAASPYL